MDLSLVAEHGPGWAALLMLYAFQRDFRAFRTEMIAGLDAVGHRLDAQDRRIARLEAPGSSGNRIPAGVE